MELDWMTSSESKSSKTSQKLRQTNENIVISEIRSLNTRVAELLEQFSLLTMEIGNVADDLERQHVGIDTCKTQFKDLKKQFSELDNKLSDTQIKVRVLEQKLSDLEQRKLEESK